MLGLVGRIVAFLLVLIIAALGARVLFVDARDVDDVEPQTGLQSQTRPLNVPEPRADLDTAEPSAEPEAESARKVTIVDPDPDLDQNADPADCPGTPELPAEPKPDVPVPH
jgi:predicted lipid-binding transport protein (Tim44 family)